MRPEHDGIVVTSVQRHPGNGPVAALGLVPRSEKRRLARPGGSRHQREPGLRAAPQPLEKSLAHQHLITHGGRMELRQQNRRSGRCDGSIRLHAHALVPAMTVAALVDDRLPTRLARIRLAHLIPFCARWSSRPASSPLHRPDGTIPKHASDASDGFIRPFPPAIAATSGAVPQGLVRAPGRRPPGRAGFT